MVNTQYTLITGTAIIYLTVLKSSLEIQAILGKDWICITKQHNPESETHQFPTQGVSCGVVGQEAK